MSSVTTVPPGVTPIVPSGKSFHTWVARTTSGWGFSSTPSFIMTSAPLSPSSAGWKTSLSVPAISSRRCAISVAMPRPIAIWASWPHACITPGLRDTYAVSRGEVLYEGKNLLEMDPEERAREGVFLAFQYPVEIPGVTNSYFLKSALNAVRKHQGLEELDAADFLTLVKEKIKLVDLDSSFLSRSVNDGFSGGEKKRNEIFQMAVLDPKLAILDETDSGLDIDALKVVADGVNKLRRPDNALIVVTHYQRLLNYIVPDYVHVLVDGRIVKSGGKDLALHLEEKGYEWLRNGSEQETVTS